MKKLIAILLVSVLVLSVFAFTGCKKEEPTLKLGLGVYTTGSASNATADVNGKAQSTVTAAAVLVDNDGKIVKAFIDCADSKVEHTAEGATIATESFKTKYELGDAYGMKAEGYGSSKEWFEHVDAFCALIVGKTASEVKALVASDNKGTQDVISAGCTIEVAEFVKAVEKAMANATASNATKNDALKL
ncbi:MAG: hypothetical protein IJX62_06225, partial [Clostridia bacterium]|nr:hypothetical protein [Clostridia bacterium]